MMTMTFFAGPIMKAAAAGGAVMDRLAAGKAVMSRGEEYFWPVPG